MITGALTYALDPGIAPAVHTRSPGVINALYFPVIFGKPTRVFIPAGTFFMGCDLPHNDGYGCIGNELPHPW